MTEQPPAIDPASGISVASTIVVKMNGEVIGYSKEGEIVVIDPEVIERIKQTMGDGHKAGSLLDSVKLTNNGASRQFDKIVKALPLAFATYSTVPFQQAAKSNTTQRNERCPCGSGKKYKHCCKGMVTNG